MSFEALEVSKEGGRPVELLSISFQQYQWRYTTAELPIYYNGIAYSPLPTERDEIESTGDFTRSNLTIKLPHDSPVGELFRVTPPSGVVSVNLFSKHYDYDQFMTLWKGRIINIQWELPWMVLTTESVFSSLQRVGLRRVFASQCPYSLYGPECGVAEVDHRAVYTVDEVSGLTVTCYAAIGQPTDYFAGGYLTYNSAIRNTLERKMIKHSVSTTGGIVLASLPLELVPGTQVYVHPGCDHSLTTCSNKFSNSLNFGGMPFIPKKNPFGGSSIY